MFSMYALISVMAVSTVLVRVINTKPAEVTIGSIDSQAKSETSLTLMERDDRESNLKYVMAIQKSSFWAEIKKRSLTISSEPHTGSLINKSPDDLSDEELTQLKQVCQDGLKCVAVDHLLILTQVMQPTDGGKTSVRTAITKITKVITQYTNEYHENTYQYEEVTDKDDTAKVYSSVTTIVEDNEELCQIDSNTYTRSNINSYATTKTNAYMSSYQNANVSSNKSSVNNSDKTFDGSPGGSSGSNLNGNSDGNTEKDGPLTIVNNGNLNFGNINTFNVNEGTMNSATLNLDPPKNPDGSYKVPKKMSINVDSEPSTAALDNTSTSQNDNQNTAGASQNDDRNTSTSQDKDTLDDGKESLNYVNIYEYGSEEPSSTGTPDSDTDTKTVNNPNQGDSSPKTVAPADSRLIQIKSAKAKRPTDTNGGEIDPNVTNNNINGDSSSNADKSKASKNITDGSADTTGSKNNALNSEKSNFVSINNAKQATQGQNHQMAGIVSAGRNNTGRLNKGYVEDGNLNNGLMKLIETNKGSINKGVINNGKSKNGIINVGNVNNGKTNYDTTNERINNGEIKIVKNYDVQQFVNNLNNMYTSMLNDLARQ